MKRARRELSIDTFIHTRPFKNNQITLFPCFTVIPKTGIRFNVVRGLSLGATLGSKNASVKIERMRRRARHSLQQTSHTHVWPSSELPSQTDIVQMTLT